MRIIKLTILSFILLFLLLSFISFFLPSRIQLSKAVKMNTVTDTLWQVVDDFTAWKEWNTLFLVRGQEPVAITPFTMKTPETEVSWKTRAPGLRVAVVQRKDRKPMISGWKAVQEGMEDSITVHWYIAINLRWYPWEKFAGMLYEKLYGEKLMQGLNRLKILVEKKRPPG